MYISIILNAQSFYFENIIIGLFKFVALNIKLCFQQEEYVFNSTAKIVHPPYKKAQNVILPGLLKVKGKKST